MLMRESLTADTSVPMVVKLVINSGWCVGVDTLTVPSEDPVIIHPSPCRTAVILH